MTNHRYNGRARRDRRIPRRESKGRARAARHAVRRETLPPVALVREPALASVTTVAEAVREAANLPGIRVLPNAMRSAKASPYTRPQEVLRALHQLSLVARERTHGILHVRLDERLRRAGVVYSAFIGNGTGTRKAHLEYEFPIDGQYVLMEEHLKFGKRMDPRHCLRVYMEWREQEGVWVIGHVGKHLSTGVA